MPCIVFLSLHRCRREYLPNHSVDRFGLARKDPSEVLSDDTFHVVERADDSTPSTGFAQRAHH
jgi:hypothetical protein